VKSFRHLCALLIVALAAAGAIAQAVGANPSAAPAKANGSTANETHCSDISGKDATLVLVSKLCEFALSYRRELPDFIAQQTTTFRGLRSSTVVTSQVTFRAGLEYYTYLTVNGKPVTPETSLPRTVRFTSAGEFGSLLVDLFTAPVAVEFKLHKTSTVRGTPVAVYEFHVPENKNTFWTLRDASGHTWKPEFRGELWLDQQTGHPLREIVEPSHLPAGCLVDSAKTVTDYAMTPVAEIGTFLLPIRSESRVCSRSRVGSLGACSTNTLVFHDYQKFKATTRILDATQEP